MSDYPTPSPDLAPDSLDDSATVADPRLRYFQAAFAPEYFAQQDENFRDAAVLAYEYEKRRLAWSRWRLPVGVGLVAVTVLALILWLLLLILGNASNGFFLWLLIIGLLLSIVFAAYCWLTLPHLTYFGRHYRRLVASPLSRGLIWSDPSTTPPDFPSLRDTFYTLYRDSDDLSSQIKPNMQHETERKKLLLGQLNRLLDPLIATQIQSAPTPFVLRAHADCLDRVTLVAVAAADLPAIQQLCLPSTSVEPDKAAAKYNRLALEIEDYSGLYTILSPTSNTAEDQLANTSKVFSVGAAEMSDQGHVAQVVGPEGEVSLIEVIETSDSPQSEPAANQTVHQQITQSVNRNLGLVERETERWQANAEREGSFDANLLAQYKTTAQVVADGYARIMAALEQEVSPALERLTSDTEFYQSQISHAYSDQRQMFEGLRDTALAKLEREHNELWGQREEYHDEMRLAQAELHNLQTQRNQLDSSTDSRFASLKQQLHDLTNRTYSLKSPPHFHSDLNIPATTTSTEEMLHDLAELRADTRFVTRAVNKALDRYAAIRFEPLDELGHLERELANSSKWQAVGWLGNFINFRQSGQLLELASDVGNAVSGYTEAVTDFERMNQRWSSLASAIQDLGLTSYSNRLEEAQQNLNDLADVLQRLYSSLVQAPHSPEMARPSTFQTLYELSAGLRRELEELGGLAGSISHTQERVANLEAQVSEFDTRLSQNEYEDQRVRQEAATKIADLLAKQDLMQTRLTAMSQERQQKIRSHIVAFQQERDSRLDELQIGALLLKDGGEIGEKILQKHLTYTDQLLDKIHQLQQNLEHSLEYIVTEFGQSVVLERCLLGASELYVPVWLCNFEERPLWRKQPVSRTSCYSGLQLLPGYYAGDVKARQSFWKFLFSRQPTTNYHLQTDNELNELVQTANLYPPANPIFNAAGPIATLGIDQLLRAGWLNVWLAPLLRRALPKR